MVAQHWQVPKVSRCLSLFPTISAVRLRHVSPTHHEDSAKRKFSACRSSCTDANVGCNLSSKVEQQQGDGKAGNPVGEFCARLLLTLQGRLALDDARRCEMTCQPQPTSLHSFDRLAAHEPHLGSSFTCRLSREASGSPWARSILEGCIVNWHQMEYKMIRLGICSGGPPSRASS